MGEFGTDARAGALIEFDPRRRMAIVGGGTRAIDISVGVTLIVSHGRGFWPWSTDVTLTAPGVLTLVESKVDDAGALQATLSAVAVGKSDVQMHDYVERSKYPDGRVPRVPNRMWILHVTVA